MSDRRLTHLAVAAGLLVRAYHYAADRTVWYDEAVLLGNVLTKDWLQLLGPLNHAVAAPPLYLFLLKLVAVACGDVQLCWRAVPFATGCLLLLATVPLCRRTLPADCVAPCVGLVAASDNHIWHTVTVKPYAGDALLTTLLLLGLVRTADWPPHRRLFALAAVAPVALCLSYPMAFVLGGVLVALLDRRAVGPWLVAAAATAGTFAALYFGPIRLQKVPGLVHEHRYFYPSADHPLGLPGWLAQHTAEVFQYCYLVGGFGLVLLGPVGVWAYGRSRRELVTALLLPFPLVMAAAGLHAYPYGLTRLMLFAAPCCLLLGGLGLAALPGRVRPWVGWGLVLACLPATANHAVIDPYPRPDSSAAARHIRTHRQPGDAVASDEQTYTYFFRGELLSLNQAAAGPARRVWVPMDHYTPGERRLYTAAYLAPGRLTLAEEVVFRGASVFLYVRGPAE
jgi:hypothetical protein